MLLIPYYKFSLKSFHTAETIRFYLQSMLKKPDSKRIINWSIILAEDQFYGSISNEEFLLTKVEMPIIGGNALSIYYKGKFKSIDEITKIDFVFRISYFTISVLLLFLGIAVFTFVYSLIEPTSMGYLWGLVMTIFYTVIMIGFNYRVSCVKKLMEKKQIVLINCAVTHQNRQLGYGDVSCGD